MFAHQLTENEKALIQHFQEAAQAIGFDGVYSLDPVDRGVLAVADLVRQQTLLKVLKELNMTGQDAAKFVFDLHRHDAPDTEEEVESQIRLLMRNG